MVLPGHRAVGRWHVGARPPQPQACGPSKACLWPVVGPGVLWAHGSINLPIELSRVRAKWFSWQQGGLCPESWHLLSQGAGWLDKGPVCTSSALCVRGQRHGGRWDHLPPLPGRWTGFPWRASSSCCCLHPSSSTSSSWRVTSTAARSLPRWWTSPLGVLDSQTSGSRRRL